VPYETLKTSGFLRKKNLKESFCNARDLSSYSEHLFQPKKLQGQIDTPIYGVFFEIYPPIRICALKKGAVDSYLSA